ncbi:MAG TPA: ABC transporter ATP-binding protein [Steroidobacteraceae bacterium]|nr:ABC transporter ATP-binding protein [Steroidobacteraceae bacterium]
MLQIQGLSKGYGEGTVVLDQLALTLQTGEYIAIMGESGSGKSTLLNLIAGLDRPDRGSVLFEGADLAGLTDDARTRLRRGGMGFIFQAFHILPYLTALQNVMLPLQLLQAPRSDAVARARDMLARCGIGALQARLPRELSGGELQRIAIARALVHRPRLLLADEPTGNLDAQTALQILQLLREQLRETGAGAILITHSATAAASADRTLHLRGGRLSARPQISTAQGL